MARTRVAIIGLGMGAKPHALALQDLAETVDVAYAVAPSAERRAKFTTDYGFATSDSVDAIIADTSVSAVGIITPPNTHLDLVSRLAAAGKHILLEKPLEVTTERAEQIVDICDKAGVKLGVVLQHRFRPAGEQLAALIGEGRLGRIVSVATSIRLWRPQSYYDEPGRGTLARDGGGVLITQGIHTLDLMLSLAGPITEVTGFATTTPVHRMEAEDLVVAACRYANGALGSIEATTAAYPGFHETIAISAEKGTATLNGTSLDVRLMDGTAISQGADGSAGGTGADPMAFPSDYHRGVWSDFLAAIAEEREPRISGREALKVHRLIDALIAAGASSSPVKVAS